MKSLLWVRRVRFKALMCHTRGAFWKAMGGQGLVVVVVTMVDGQVDRVVDHVGYCTDFTFLFFFFFPAGYVLLRSYRVIPFGREECINEVP